MGVKVTLNVCLPPQSIINAGCDKWQHSYWRCSICLSKTVTETPIEKGSTCLSIEHCLLTAHKNYSEKHWIFNSAVNITVNSGSCSGKVSTSGAAKLPMQASISLLWQSHPTAQPGLQLCTQSRAGLQRKSLLSWAHPSSALSSSLFGVCHNLSPHTAIPAE